MKHLTTDTKPTITWVAVTPEMAHRWLAGNTVNRKIRKRVVDKYARDMVAGRWLHSNDAIAFSPDGKLLNGQHRLNAVIQSGITIVFAVARNIPPESMTAMDSGTGRTASDALGFANERNTALLASTAKFLLLHSDGRIYQDTHRQAVSHGEILDFVDVNPSVRVSVDDFAQAARSIDAPPTAVLASHWLIAHQHNDFEHADLYINQLATRANEPAGSAVLAVDSRLREVRRNRTTFATRNFVYLLIKGWNHYARDQHVRTLSMKPRGGQFRIPTPVSWQRGPVDVP